MMQIDALQFAICDVHGDSFSAADCSHPPPLAHHLLGAVITTVAPD
jgi:hypothetical protein